MTTFLKVLHVAARELVVHEWRPLKQAVVARELDMCQKDVSIYLRKLIEDGILLAGPKDGMLNTYRLNREHQLIRRFWAS